MSVVRVFVYTAAATNLCNSDVVLYILTTSYALHIDKGKKKDMRWLPIDSKVIKILEEFLAEKHKAAEVFKNS